MLVIMEKLCPHSLHCCDPSIVLEDHRSLSPTSPTTFNGLARSTSFFEEVRNICIWLETYSMTDIDKQDHFRAIAVNDDSVSTQAVRDCDVVVVLYSYLTAEARRIEAFQTAIKAWKEAADNGQAPPAPPKRPHVPLLSGLLQLQGVKPMGKHIVLNNAHIIHDVSTDTYAAVHKLRALFEVCIMLTSTPLYDDFWDLYSYLTLLGGHPFGRFAHFRFYLILFISSSASRIGRTLVADQ
jgi:hypothetical protein